MSKAVIRIAYDGPAVEDGRMDVRELSPALLALGSAIQETSNIIYGKERTVKVLIRSDFKPGSFEILIDVVQSFKQTLIDYGNGEAQSGAANLIEILGFGYLMCSTSVIGTYKFLKGRKPKSITSIGNDNVRIEVDNEQITIRSSTAKVFQNEKVRNAIHDAMAPIASNGITSFEVRNPETKTSEKNPKIIQRITTDELPYFEPPKEEPMAENPIDSIESSRKVLLTLISPNFQEGLLWKFSDGQSSINAAIEDDEFLDEVKSHRISFHQDDRITCEMATRQYDTPTGIKTEHKITKIIKHIHMPSQIQLNIDNKNDKSQNSSSPTVASTKDQPSVRVPKKKPSPKKPR